MEMTFLGTRGEIEARSRRHQMHSSLLVSDGNNRVMIDCGSDWIRNVGRVCPAAIVLTHAHPDHAGGLKNGALCPVFATAETWNSLKNFPIGNRRFITPYKRFHIGKLIFRAFSLEHSIRAPAVGFRVSQGGASFFYAPDVASIPDHRRALRAIDIYVGDGATVLRPLIRKRDGSLIGHAPIAAQVNWCKTERVRRAIFTHCGSQIVSGNERSILDKVQQLGFQSGIDATLAFDGLRIVI